MAELSALKWHRFESLQNGWEHFGSISRPPSFFKDDLGRVFLSGTVTNGRPNEPGGTRSKIWDCPKGSAPFTQHISRWPIRPVPTTATEPNQLCSSCVQTAR